MSKQSGEAQTIGHAPAPEEGRTIGRRRALKVGLAAAGGLTLAGTYVKPDMLSIGVPEAYAASQVPPPPPPAGQCSLDLELTVDCNGGTNAISGALVIRNVSTSCVDCLILDVDVDFEQVVRGGKVPMPNLHQETVGGQTEPFTLGCVNQNVGQSKTINFSVTDAAFAPDTEWQVIATVHVMDPASKNLFDIREEAQCVAP